MMISNLFLSLSMYILAFNERPSEINKNVSVLIRLKQPKIYDFKNAIIKQS